MAKLLQLLGKLMFVKKETDKDSLEQYMKVHEKSEIVNQKLFTGQKSLNIKNIKLVFRSCWTR